MKDIASARIKRLRNPASLIMDFTHPTRSMPDMRLDGTLRYWGNVQAMTMLTCRSDQGLFDHTVLFTEPI